MNMSLLAILELEREPLQLAQLPQLLLTWVQDAGGFAAVGLLIYLVNALISGNKASAGDRTQARLFPAIVVLATLALVAYGAAAVFFLNEPPAPVIDRNPNPAAPKPVPAAPTQAAIWRARAVTVGGAFAILGITLPFFADMTKLRWRRIWALAKLSFREAIRRRVLWVFLAFFLVFLFPPKWFYAVKPENDVRDSIAVIDFAKFVVMLFAFSLLAAFSIPTDLRQQTIHTIVTKPVEKFEVVLGRFLGYVGLATLVLVVLRSLAALMIFASNVSAEAAFESFQAREPVYGEMEFRENRGGVVQVTEGESVGREWEYRKYMQGGPRTRHRAAFMFRNLPSSIAGMTAVPVEFAFDIFRTTKGEEGKGLQVSLVFQSSAWNEQKRPEYLDELKRLGLNPNRNPQPEDADWDKWNQVTEKFGYFEYRGKEIADYHLFRIVVPAGLFRNALNQPEPPAIGGKIPPRLEVLVKCESRTQFLGVAKRDLYLLAGNHSFLMNFYKGAFGLWLMLCLVIGLAVTCSTCLSGVVSWLTAIFIVGAGYFRDFIRELAEGRNIGGGPTESLVRLVNNQNLIVDLPDTPGRRIAEFADRGYRFIFDRFLNLIPDVERFDWSNYVAEGFNIPVVDMALTALVLVGYLFPWAVLAYYLMKSREIAN